VAGCSVDASLDEAAGKKQDHTNTDADPNATDPMGDGELQRFAGLSQRRGVAAVLSAVSAK
jgi:hypothetical protein